MKHHIGHRIHFLHWCTNQNMSNALAQMDLTASQGRILGYLVHSKEPPCPKDIENTFQLSHPTVSGLLTRLEKKGFLELRPDPRDRRCKRIHTLPKALECSALMEQTIRSNEALLVKDFTPQEQELFIRLLERAIGNMTDGQCKIKEEPKTND